MAVACFTGKRAYSARRIAEVLASKETDEETRRQRMSEIQSEAENSEVAMKAYLREAQKLPLTAKDIEVWKNLPCRRCPSCLLSNPEGCAECLTCGVKYGTRVTKEAVQENSLPTSNKRTVEQDEDDDEKIVTWDEEHNLPYIEPTRSREEYGLP
jgi:hypothetical protein